MENLIKDIYYQIKDLVRRIAYLEAHDGVSDLSSAMSFVQLTDTPNDYVGDGGKVVVVNAAETGLEFQEDAGAGPFDVDLPPSTPSTYDDEFNDESLDPAWTERDVLNSVTVSEEGETLVLTCTGGTHMENYHHHIFGVGKESPAGSYQAVVRVRVTDTLTDGCGIGIGLKFPTAEKYIYVHAFSNPEGGTQTTIYYKAYFGSGGGEGTIATYAETNPWVYLRLRYNDTVTTLWIDSSLDGLTWSSSPGYDLSTAGESPNEILVSIGGSTQNGDVGVCDFFRVREVAGNASDPVYGDYGALEAGQVSYTPTTPADWTDPDPATVQDALDTLAARESGAALTVQEADGTPTVTAVDTIVVTNGTLTDDGGGQVTLDFGSAATDGAAIHDDVSGEIAALTEKTTPVAADMLLIEDSAASNAKKMVQIGNLPGGSGGSYLPAFTAPVLTNFSWVNQETATAVDENNSVYLYAPAVGGDKWRSLVMAAPATPYVVTAALLPVVYVVEYAKAGLCFRQSSDSKLIVFGLGENGLNRIVLSKYTNDTSYHSWYLNASIFVPSPIWLRIADDGTNRVCSWSADGFHWIVIHTVGRTDFLTADQIGFCVNSCNGTFPAALTLLSWSVE